MRIAKPAGLWIVLLLVIATVYQPAAAETSGSLWFPWTRHFVQDDFLKFYQNAPDPLTLFGYPITDAFVDQTGHLTQYFQRARFDLLMTEKGPVVVLANLGWMLYDDNGAPPNFAASGPTCRLFPSTGKNVCYAFLQFYDSFHGETFFGDPISNAELRDGRIVQYFEKVRLEYLKNLPEGHRVILTMLGQAAYNIYVKDPRFTNQTSGLNAIPIPKVIDSLTSRAYVRRALVSRGMTQTAFLIVQDQNLRPVKGAQASITIVYPDGSKYTDPKLGKTGTDGVFRYELPVPDLAPLQVVTLEISVELQGLKAKTVTWFRIWY